MARRYCNFEPSRFGGVRCRRCRDHFPRMLDARARRECNGNPALGDLIEIVLGWVGFRKKAGCNCDGRRVKINRLAWAVWDAVFAWIPEKKPRGRSQMPQERPSGCAIKTPGARSTSRP